MSKKIIAFLPVIILIAVSFLSIGYASINSIALDIEGHAEATPPGHIYITNAEYVSDVNANKDNSKVNNFYETMFDSHIELSNTDIKSSITYNITIYNSTVNDYAFKEVVYAEEWYDNPDITFDLEGLNPGDKLPSKQSISFNITFHYNSNKITNNILNSYLEFSFKKLHPITYVDIINEGYPTEIMEDDTLQLNFKSAIDYVTVYINGIEIDTFTYKKPTLIIPNANGDITIKKETYDNIDYVIDKDNTTITDSTISNSNPIKVTDLLTKSYEGKNTTLQTINPLQVTYTYTNKTGAAQSINCVLEVNGQTYKQLVPLDAKGNNKQITVSFDVDILRKQSFTISTETASLSNGNVSFSGYTVTVNFKEEP